MSNEVPSSKDGSEAPQARAVVAPPEKKSERATVSVATAVAGAAASAAVAASAVLLAEGDSPAEAVGRLADVSMDAFDDQVSPAAPTATTHAASGSRQAVESHATGLDQGASNDDDGSRFDGARSGLLDRIDTLDLGSANAADATSLRAQLRNTVEHFDPKPGQSVDDALVDLRVEYDRQVHEFAQDQKLDALIAAERRSSDQRSERPQLTGATVATSSDGQDVPELRQAAIADAGARSTDQEGERHATGLDVEEERHPTGLDMEGERHATGLDVNGERPTTFVDVVGEQRTAGLDVDEEPLSSALGSEDNQSSGFDIEQPTVGAEMADEGHDLGTEVTTESTTGLPEGYVGVPGFAGGTIVIGPDGQAITAEGLTELGVDPSGYENVHFEDSVEASSTSGDIEIGTVRNRQEPLQYDTNPSERLPAPPRVPQFDRHEPRAEQTTADGLRTSPPEPDRSSTDPEYYRPEADPKLRGPMPDPSNDHYRPRLEQTNDGPRTSSFEPRHSSALQSDLTQDFELSDDFDAAAGMFGDSADGIDTWNGADSGIDAPEVGQAAMPAATLDPLDDLGLPIPVAADVTVASIDVPELDLAYAHTQEAAGRLLDGDLSGAADAGFEAERDLSDGYNHARQQVEDTLLHFARENTGLADAATSDFAAIDDDSGAYEPVGTVEGITDDQGF